MTLSARPTRTIPVLLAIDGRSGAGKSTLAASLCSALLARGFDTELFHVEDVYRGWHGLTAGLEHYASHVVAPLSRGEEARWFSWDWEHERTNPTPHLTRAANVVICEGVGAGCREARPNLTATLTLAAPATLRKDRALTRDGDTFLPFWDVWAAQEARLVHMPDAALDLTLDVASERQNGERALAWALTAITAARS